MSEETPAQEPAAESAQLEPAPLEKPAEVAAEKPAAELPPVGTVLQLSEEEQEKLVRLRSEYRESKLQFADASLQKMAAEDRLHLYRQNVAAKENDLSKFTADVLGARGLDPTDPAKSGSWRFDLSTMKFQRVG